MKDKAGRTLKTVEIRFPIASYTNVVTSITSIIRVGFVGLCWIIAIRTSRITEVVEEAIVGVTSSMTFIRFNS